MMDDPKRVSAAELLPIVYDELRRLAAAQIAAESPGHTLQATELVHEAYIRLTQGDDQRLFVDKRHFCAAAALAIRHLLVDRARAKRALKRGGTVKRQQLRDFDLQASDIDERHLDVDEALTALAERYPEVAELVQLRFYIGQTLPEAATIMNISPRTAARHWAFAQAWLKTRLVDAESESKGVFQK